MLKQKKFVVDRSTWRCGGPIDYAGGQTVLLNEKGYRCCLGFACAQLYGLSDAELFGKGLPSTAIQSLFFKRRWALEPNIFFDRLQVRESSLQDLAAKINDDPHLSPARREADLTALFAERGIEVEFTGEYRDWTLGR